MLSVQKAGGSLGKSTRLNNKPIYEKMKNLQHNQLFVCFLSTIIY